MASLLPQTQRQIQQMSMHFHLAPAHLHDQIEEYYINQLLRLQAYIVCRHMAYYLDPHSTQGLPRTTREKERLIVQCVRACRATHRGIAGAMWVEETVVGNTIQWGPEGDEETELRDSAFTESLEVSREPR